VHCHKFYIWNNQSCWSGLSSQYSKNVNTRMLLMIGKNFNSTNAGLNQVCMKSVYLHFDQKPWTIVLFIQSCLIMVMTNPPLLKIDVWLFKTHDHEWCVFYCNNNCHSYKGYIFCDSLISGEDTSVYFSSIQWARSKLL